MSRFPKRTLPQVLLIVIAVVVVGLFLIPWSYESGTDKDTWHILNVGRYIVENGLTNIEPFSCHDGMHYFPQQWLGGIIAYGCFTLGGVTGYMLLVYAGVALCAIASFFVARAKELPEPACLFIAFFTLFLTAVFAGAKLRIFDILLMLIALNLLLRYSATKKARYLAPIPFLAYATICIHATMWPLLFLVGAGYIVGMIIHREELRSIATVAIFGGIAFLAMLANPYGIEAVTYIFTSMSPEITNVIGECLSVPLVLLRNYPSPLLFFLAGTAACYLAIRSPQRDFRIIIPYIGLAILSFSSSRNIALMLGYTGSLLCVLPFRNAQEKNRDDSPIARLLEKKAAFVTIVVCECIAIAALLIPLCNLPLARPNDSIGKIVYEDIISRGESVDDNSVFVTDGSQEEFDYHLRCYYDARAEVYLFENNRQYDYRGEIIAVEGNFMRSDSEAATDKLVDFVTKYDFDYVVSPDWSSSLTRACESLGYVVIGTADDEYQSTIFRHP